MVNRFKMSEADLQKEEFELSQKSGMKVTSMITCIVFEKNGKEAFVLHFKDKYLTD